jgi:hypothetical protein
VPVWLYKDKVDIIISEDDFYRYGWEITTTDARAFHREVEAKAKFFMRSMVAVYDSVMLQNQAIRTFQEKFGFSEDIWSFDSIKKDYFRNADISRLKIIDIIRVELEKKSLGHLYELGTIETPHILANENNN